MQARQLPTWQGTTGACALTSPVLYNEVPSCHCVKVLGCHHGRGAEYHHEEVGEYQLGGCGSAESKTLFLGCHDSRSSMGRGQSP